MSFSSRKIHVFGQGQQHEEVILVANTDALRKLRDSIDAALSDGNAKFEAMTEDGEGFHFYIMHENNDQTWDKLAFPYTYPEFEVCNKKRMSPWQLPGFVELMKKPIDT